MYLWYAVLQLYSEDLSWWGVAATASVVQMVPHTGDNWKQQIVVAPPLRLGSEARLSLVRTRAVTCLTVLQR